MSRKLYAVLLMFLHRLLSADAQKGMLVAHCDSRDNAFACKVLLDMGSMHVSLALPCWGCMGREQKSGVKSRHRSKEWDTLQKPNSLAPSSQSLHLCGPSNFQLSCHMPHGWIMAGVPQKASLSARPALGDHSSAKKCQSGVLFS